MIFNSFAFLYFLAIVFTVYFILPHRWRNYFLLGASYFFYGYWSVKYLFLLIFTMVLDYVIALKIFQAREKKKRKLLLIASIAINIGILFIFKYLNLFYWIFSSLIGRSEFHPLDIILPFGISFYTFHAMSYTIDVYRGIIPAEENFVFYSGYVMFFPQLVAGPIARASHLLHQFKEPKFLKAENLNYGFYLMARGFIMKVVLADRLAGYVDANLDHRLSSPFLMVQAVYFFAFQIYFDFAGYTDIARGVAKLFDFDLVLNFNRPYIAESVTDFWRRWHISLSTWLRDYLYISLGGNRNGKVKTYQNLMATMLLGGLWHGANLTFVVWGGLHGLYLTFEKAMEGTAINKIYRKVAPRWVRILITFHLVCFAWIFFRSSNFVQAYDWIHQIGIWITHISATTRPEFQTTLWFMVFTWMMFELMEAKFELLQKYIEAPWVIRPVTLAFAIVLISLFAELNPKAFIYFQF